MRRLGGGFGAGPAFPQLLAIEGGDLTSEFPESGPSDLRGACLLGMLGRDVEGMALTVLAPSEVKIGTMSAGRIGMARAGGLAAGAGGRGETALDHGLSGGGELFEEGAPTHVTEVG